MYSFLHNKLNFSNKLNISLPVVVAYAARVTMTPCAVVVARTSFCAMPLGLRTSQAVNVLQHSGCSMRQDGQGTCIPRLTISNK